MNRLCGICAGVEGGPVAFHLIASFAAMSADLLPGTLKWAGIQWISSWREKLSIRNAICWIKYWPDCCFGFSKELRAAWLSVNIRTFWLLLSSTTRSRAMTRLYHSPKYTVNCWSDTIHARFSCGTNGQTLGQRLNIVTAEAVIRLLIPLPSV